MSVVHAIVGAPTPDGATFVTKVDGGGPVRVAVSTSQDMSSPVFTTSESVDAQGVAKVSITGLSSSTQHWWQVEDDSTLDTSVTGRFRTAPTAGSAASFTFAAAGDAGAGDSGHVTDRVSNHPVFDTIRGHNPDFFIHMGDMHYRDIGSGVYTSAPFDETDYRDAFDDMLTFNGVEGTADRQQHLFREVPLVPTWDNHDYGFTTGSAIDSDRTMPHRAAARAVFRERMPTYPLPAGSGDNPIYYSFTYGRVLIVMLDERSERDPNTDPDDTSKTMLGSAQKAWLDNLLATSDAEALCVMSGGQWLTVEAESDTWQVYQTEQAELVDMFAEHNWLHRMFMITASKHALGLDAGSGNRFGGFPVALFAALDAGGAEVQQNLYDQGPTQPGAGQFGEVTITDLGDSIIVDLTGYDSTGVWDSIRFGIAVSSPTETASATVEQLAPIVSGSHRMVAEARVLSTFQTGHDPDGETIEILDGQVVYDATAEVFAALELTTSGMDERRRSRFPRTADSLLAPYGREVFVRRGVDLGGAGIVWVPLGYFRLTDAEQTPASDSPIRLSGMDRMSGIIDARMVIPRQYRASQTIGAVVTELVTDVYPSATIVFDDDSGQEALGRQLLVEEDRYAALLDIAESLGKVVFWDGEGVLRIEDAPDPDDLVWDIKAASSGVLIETTRRVSREGMANAVVARGEGGDTVAPVQAIAVDDGPNSPTRWFGPPEPGALWFGRVPHFYSSPLLTTRSQALSAAISLLQRRIGMPYSVDWGSVVNAALRPRQAVRITHKSGDLEEHIVDTLTIPLVYSRPMSGTTKEQTLVRITETSPSALGGS